MCSGGGIGVCWGKGLVGGESVVALVHMTQYRKQIKPGPEGVYPSKFYPQ